MVPNIDTGTPEGRLFFHITAAFDEFQRELIVENTRAGLAAARKRGGGAVGRRRWTKTPSASPRRCSGMPRTIPSSATSSITSGSEGPPSIGISRPIVSANSASSPERRSRPVSLYVPLRKTTQQCRQSPAFGKGTRS